MARQVRSKIGWDERNRNKVADRARPSGIIHNILRHKHRVTGSTSCMGHERPEGFNATLDFASAKQPEALLRRARMLQ